MDNVNYGAWGGLATAGDSFLKAYQAGQQRKLQLAQLGQQKALQDSEIARNNAAVDQKEQTVDGGILDPKLKGVKIPGSAALPYLAAKIKAGGQGGIVFSPKDKDTISRITQGLTNLKNVEKQFSDNQMDSTGAGLQGMAQNIPLIGKNVFMQNATPGTTKYNQSAEEAKNAYSRATFGRVSNEILEHSKSLFPKPGTDKKLAKSQLDELASTLMGVGQGLANEQRNGTPEGEQRAKAIEDQLQQNFGDYRFFPELDNPNSQEGQNVKTNFRPSSTISSGASRPPLSSFHR